MANETETARRSSVHGMWSSRLVFILAATGSAVGLGNIWKFPYITGEYGGGAFVLVYLVCIALIGVPIMMAEVMLGRRGRQSPINTMRALAAAENRSSAWAMLGWLGVAAGFLILSYYSVIAGWALSYVFHAAVGTFDGQTADGVASIFNGLTGDPEKLIAWHSIFIFITMAIVAQGVKKGLERTVTYLMPALAGMLVVLVIYALNNADFRAGFEFLFYPDFSKISPDAVLAAMGHAFFTLSLGMGAIMIYGSYMPENASIGSTCIIIAIADTVVALLAGLAIFPLVFAYGLEPGQGAGLIFSTLPIAFGQMPWGSFFGTLFFLLLTIAALTSAISLIEPAVAWLVENKSLSRVRASIYSGLGVWVLGLGSVLSFNVWSEKTLSLTIKIGETVIPLVEKATFFDSIDYLTSSIMLPLGGLLIALFAGYSMSTASTKQELALKDDAYKVWRVLVRYITPVLVLIVFLHALGMFD
ncbi:MAG: sodium-dependent transporter [Gammaproteobacteria bacterium]|nr:sodium-dependent transporter [Gammaproteobacteria bacterium]